MSTATRPWQGTVLGILNAIGVFFGLLAALGFFFAGAAIAPYLEQYGLAMLAGAGTAAIGGIILAFVILGLFITIGIFKGQKWTIILSLIFIGLSLLGNIFSFNIIGLIINGFMFYLAFICLKDAYYN
ncbi:hypothetical protein [Carboxylicivirga linearis]|uniref:DUF4064 domain-containing protein n=1 Tax=Carboxylicivirga linearis TaxID=1628157 RepID=A0ABS5JTI8_9BACT|nr:hypothetical protein [Carboxylicivirga linearis]MBS2098194.1 hypothetical protein [Carboxylicivirga linearis]